MELKINENTPDWIKAGLQKQQEREARREAAYADLADFRTTVKEYAKAHGLTARVNDHTFREQGGLGISGYDLVLFKGQDEVVFEKYLGEVLGSDREAKLAECLKAIDETAAKLSK